MVFASLDVGIATEQAPVFFLMGANNQNLKTPKHNEKERKRGRNTNQLYI